MADLAAAVVRVERHDGGTELVQGQEVKEMAWMVAHGQGDPVAGAPPLVGVGFRQRVDGLAGLLEGPDGPAAERGLRQERQMPGAPARCGEGLVQSTRCVGGVGHVSAAAP